MNFFDEYYKTSLKIRSQSARREFITAIVDYYYTGEEPKFKNETAEVAFTAIRFSLDKSRTNASNRRKEPATVQEGAENESGTNRKGNVNEAETKSETVCDSTGEKEKEKEKEKETPIPPETYAEIVGYLNERTGKAFKPTSEATRKLIRARLAEGYGIPDFERVIDNKCADWKGDAKMDRYLKPETLFAKSHFEGYLNERASGKEAADGSPYTRAW